MYPEDAVNTTLSPWQKVVGPPAVMTGLTVEGTMLAVTAVLGEMQPLLPAST